MRTRSRRLRLALALALCAVGGFGTGNGLGTNTPGVYTGGLFQLGDGHTPPLAGTADILSTTPNPQQLGPDWQGLFNADRTLRDDSGNGVPDYIDLYGGQWAVFMADDVSRGTAVDTTALAANGRVYNGTVAAADDLGNAYVYATFDDTQPTPRLVLYAGVERLSGADSYIEFEFDQAHVRLGHGPPWQITGAAVPGDLRVRLSFQGGTLGSTLITEYRETTPGVFAYQTVETLTGEGCDGAETACVFRNGASIDGGPWPNFNSPGNPEVLGAGSFAELGVNVGALLGGNPNYTSIQVRTPHDIAFGYFAEGN